MWTSSNAGLYQPNCADTPVVSWLHSIGVTEPLGPAATRPGFGLMDGLSPLPMTVRELEAAGMYEGDTGHTTAPRPGQQPYRRQEALAAGVGDGQSGKERLDAVERASLSRL